YIVRFYRAFAGKAVPIDLTLFHSGSLERNPPRSSDLRDFVASQDIIYVSGGNTANQLAMWRVHGLDHAFRDAWIAGKIFCGLSAGMICWFRASVTDSFGSLDRLDDGLGFIDASACPHYDGEPGRRPAYHQFIRDGLPDGFAADDGAALHFIGTELVEVVTSRRDARAFQVENTEAGVVESELPSRFLG
ncbi:MAG: peptidase E, partial [Verrucomicrobiota bacterium]